MTSSVAGLPRLMTRRVGRSESGAERGPASAGGLRARIANDELRTLEIVAEIDLGAAQVLETHRIDQQLHALVLDAGVAVLDFFVEFEAVLQARAAATLHEYAQHELGIAFTGNQLADLARCRIGEKQRRLKAFGGGFGSSVVHNQQCRRAARSRPVLGPAVPAHRWKLRRARGRYRLNAAKRAKSKPNDGACAVHHNQRDCRLRLELRSSACSCPGS